MHVVVTGAGGLLGRAVVSDLRANGHVVRPIDLHAPNGETWGAIDLRDRKAADATIRDADAVAHLAAWPNPMAVDARTGWTDNIGMTANTLFAALDAGVERFIYASSQTVLGLAWADPIIPPDYVPVDEDHACRPSDWYGASKLAGEYLVESYARNGQLSAYSLRFPVIWEASDFDRATGRRRSDPIQAARSQWAYVDARDAARAVRLSIETQSTGYRLLNIAAPRVFSAERVPELVKRWFPSLTVTDDVQAVFDSRRAETVLGFRGRYLWDLGGITTSD